MVLDGGDEVGSKTTEESTNTTFLNEGESFFAKVRVSAIFIER